MTLFCARSEDVLSVLLPRCRHLVENRLDDIPDSVLTQSGYYFGLSVDMLERGLAEGSRSKVAKAIAKRVLRDGGPHPNYFLFLGARLEQIPNLSEIQTAVQLHPTFLIPQMPVAVLKGFLPENLARGEGVLKVWARLRPYFLRNVGEVAAFADQFPNVWPEVVDLIKEKAESGAVGDMEGGFNTSGITGLFKWCMGRRDVAQESRNELAYWFYSRYRQHGPNLGRPLGDISDFSLILGLRGSHSGVFFGGF